MYLLPGCLLLTNYPKSNGSKQHLLSQVSVVRGLRVAQLSKVLSCLTISHEVAVEMLAKAPVSPNA